MRVCQASSERTRTGMSFRSRQGQDPTHPRTGTLLRTTPVEQLSARGSRARVVTNACMSLLAGSCPAAFEIVVKRRKFAPSFAPAVAARPRSRCNRGRCGRRAGHSLIPRCSTCTVTHLTRHSSRQPGSPFQFCKRQARPGHLHYHHATAAAPNTPRSRARNLIWWDVAPAVAAIVSNLLR